MAGAACAEALQSFLRAVEERQPHLRSALSTFVSANLR